MKSRQNISGIQTFPAIMTLLAVAIVSLVIGAKDAQDDLDGKQANYCEMRSIYIDSGTEYGWPRMDGYGECK